MLDRALSWLAANLDWFDPPRWEEFLPRRGFPESPLLELLVLCRLVRSRDDFVRPCLDLASEVTGRPAFRAGLHRADAGFTYRVWLIALMEHLGRESGLREDVQDLLDAGVGDVCNPGRPATALLELSYVLRLGGFACPLPEPEKLYEGGRLAHGVDPLYVTDDETYAITHEMFYLTDFGRRDVGGLPAELVSTLLGVHLARGDLDLSAELLLCAETAGVPDDLAGAAWNRLGTAQREDGAVPGPLHQPARHAGAEGRRAAAYLFGTCYHTTLVTALAAAAYSPRPASAELPMPSAVRLALAVRAGDLRALATLLPEAPDEPITTRAAAFLAFHEPDRCPALRTG